MTQSRRPRGTGSIFRKHLSRFWWVSYYRSGKIFRESTGETDKRKAEKFLQKRIAQIATGTFVGFNTEKVTIDELAPDLLRDYKINGKKSLSDVETRWQLHLQPFLGHVRANNITTPLLSQYVDKRQQENASNATINRELACLKRMMNLGVQSGKVLRVCHFPHLTEDNIRTGFVESDQYDKLANEFAKVGLWMRALFECGYCLGWRISELLNLKVGQVDLVERIIKLHPGTTKNTKGRTAKLTELLYQLLQQCCSGKKGSDYVFTRENGKRISDFRVVWSNACKQAELPNLLFHDLRRTACRNMVRAGISEHTAMKISGHRTRAIFDRYDIVSERDLADATAKLERHQLYTQNEHSEAISATPTTEATLPN